VKGKFNKGQRSSRREDVPVDEARVIARAAQGDEDAFELLVLKYRRDVTRTVLFSPYPMPT